MPRVKKVVPVVTGQTIDTLDQEGPKATEVTMPSMGDPELHREPLVVVEGKRVNKEKLEELAFMEEEIVVELATTTDPQDPGYVPTYNNGRTQNFFRGVKQKVKRKFVEVLARMKPENVRNVEYRDQNDVQSVKWVKTPALKHSFQVHGDSPKGQAWLQRILREPN